MWCIALFNCKMQRIKKNSLTFTPLPTHSLICMKTILSIGLKNSPFFQVTLCLLQGSQSTHISYKFTKPPIFFNIFMSPSTLAFPPPPSFQLLPDKHSQILLIFTGIIAYLWKRIMHLKNIIHMESLYFDN